MNDRTIREHCKEIAKISTPATVKARRENAAKARAALKQKREAAGKVRKEKP